MRRVIVELTRTALRAVACDGTPPRLRVQKFVVEPVSGPPTAETIRSVLAALPTGGTQLIGVIPRDQTITRLLKLPSTKPEELAQMVALTGKAQLPYPSDQALVDFHVIEQEGGMSVVQLVACHRDQLNRHLAVWRQLGLEPVVATPSSWGLLTWYQRLGRSPAVQEPVMIVNVDADRTDLALIRGDRLVFSRSLSQGVRALEATTEAIGVVAQELEQSFASLRKEWPGMETRSLLLTGLGPLAQWKEVLEQRLQRPVTVTPSQGTLRLSEPLPAGASPVVALGLAMAAPSALVNLLPPEVRQAQRHRLRLQEFMVTGVLLVAALLLGAGLLSASVSRQTHLNTTTIQAVKDLEALTQQTERQEREIAIIQAVQDSRRGTALMLAELFRLTGPEILFESVVFEGSRRELVVRGNAPETRQVLDYLRQLKHSDTWDQVELRYSARRGTTASARTDFEIVLHREAPHGTARAPSP